MKKGGSKATGAQAVAAAAGLFPGPGPELPSGTVLKGLWRLGDIVGRGACGNVYKVTSIKPLGANCDYEMVAKVIPTGKDLNKTKAKEQKRICDSLHYEYTLISGHFCRFSRRPRVPERFYDTDLELGLRYLVMEKMDCSLTDFALTKPSLSDIASIGLQLVEGMQYIHDETGFLLLDIKPDNFVLKNGNVYFVDFGVAELPTARTPGRALVGNYAFASRAVLNGSLNQKKDDMESVALLIMSLTNDGQMPWSEGVTSDAELRNKILSCDISTLAASMGCPEMAEVILNYRSLVSNERPDYDFFKEKLIAMRDRGASSTSPKKVGKKRSAASGEAGGAGGAREIGVAGGAGGVGRKQGLGASTAISQDGEEKITSKSKSPRLKRIPTNPIEVDDEETDKNEDVDGGPFSSPYRAKMRRRSRDSTGTSSSLTPQQNIPARSLSFQAISGPMKGTVFPGNSSNESSGVGTSRDIGRNVDSKTGLQIDDDYVSERHAVLMWSWGNDGACEINVMDKKSTNGTKVNGVSLTANKWYNVGENDTIKFGQTEIKCVVTTSNNKNRRTKK